MTQPRPTPPMEELFGDNDLANYRHAVRFLPESMDLYTFGEQSDAASAAYHLMTCNAHGGVHHFAVFGEGRSLGVSATATRCLKEAGLLQ